MSVKKVCQECGNKMDDWGMDVVRYDTGEHYMCYWEHYWGCTDHWCGGSESVMVGGTWQEAYEEKDSPSKITL